MKNWLFLFLGATIIFSCSKDDSGDDGGNGLSSMTASIDGTIWESSDDNPNASTGTSFLKNTPRYYLLNGYAEDGSSIILYVYGISEDIVQGVTYDVGPSFAAKYAPESFSSGNVFSTDDNSQGSLTFSTLEDDRVVGTFSFTAKNGTDEVSVTNGEFNITD